MSGGTDGIRSGGGGGGSEASSASLPRPPCVAVLADILGSNRCRAVRISIEWQCRSDRVRRLVLARGQAEESVLTVFSWESLYS